MSRAAEWTEEQIAALRAMDAEGLPQREMAARLGKTIHMIQSGWAGDSVRRLGFARAVLFSAVGE